MAFPHFRGQHVILMLSQNFLSTTKVYHRVGGGSPIKLWHQRFFFASSSDKTRARAAGMSRVAKDHRAIAAWCFGNQSAD